MYIQIVSDLHLEFHPLKKTYSFIKPNAPLLCILGDLCCCDILEIKKINNFFTEISVLFKLIIWIPGNHEYYQDKHIDRECTINAIEKRCRKICSNFPNIKFLKNQTIELKSKRILYRFICSTLWSHIPNKLGKTVQSYMSDYDKIYVWNGKDKCPRNITYKDVNIMHRKCVNFIKSEINISKNKKSDKKYKDVKTIILTHHKPFSSKSDYSSDVERVAYESDQTDIFSNTHVNFWAYGHTHRSCKENIYNTLIISNPKGYPYQRTKFKKGMRITI